MVNSSVGRNLVAAVVIVAGSLTGLCTQAIAASGTINIQTVPEGAKFFVVERRDLKIVAGGMTPYFDMAFPTGKYTVCFELDGYLTAWEHSYVQTSGSSWVGPVMKPSNNVPQSTCGEIVARVKAEKAEYRASILQQLSTMEPISWSPGDSSDVPDSTGGGQSVEYNETHETYQVDGQIRDDRRPRIDGNRAETIRRENVSPLPVNRRR